MYRIIYFSLCYNIINILDFIIFFNGENIIYFVLVVKWKSLFGVLGDMILNICLIS